MSKRKLVLAYICLVGLPLLALAGVIRAGQHLIAPISVGGAWNLETDFGSLGSGPCRTLLAEISQPFFSVSQSGANLVLTLNNPQKTALPGELQGRALTIGNRRVQTSENASGGCGNPGTISLAATVAQQGRQRVMTGTLGINGCASCPPVAFRATRQSSSGRGGL